MAGTPAYMMVILMLILLGLYVSGYKLLDVQSDSMVPTISKGDTVLMDTREKAYTPGQIVAYRSLIDENVLITHRVVDEYQDGKLIATQGDALTARDPAIPRDQIEGRVIAVLPMLGAVTSPLRSAYVVNISIFALGAVIIGLEIRRADAKINPAKYRLNRYSGAM